MAGARNVMDPRSTRRTRNFLSTEDRIFLVATLEILEEIFNKEWPGPEMLWIHGGHGSSEFKRMLNGIIFLVAYGKKSLEEIFFKEWPEARNDLFTQPP